MTEADMDLVRAYAGGSDLAFETLVSRHIGLIYSSALRQTRDPQLAEEITQAVFTILARKAVILESRDDSPRLAVSDHPIHSRQCLENKVRSTAQ